MQYSDHIFYLKFLNSANILDIEKKIGKYKRKFVIYKYESLICLLYYIVNHESIGTLWNKKFESYYKL